jgi:methanogenic corrinoid protein MtbC1
MPEINTAQPAYTGAHHFKPVSSAALELFHQTLPKLLVFVNEKLNLENKFLREEACCKKTDLAEDFNRKFAALLAGVYEFSLFQYFADEFSWLLAEQESRGLPRTFLEPNLKAWILGINSMIRRPESADLVQPIDCLHRYLPMVYAQLEAQEPELDKNGAAFVEHLLRKSRKFAAEFIITLIREGGTIEQAYTQVLLPALTRMRHLWRKNKVSAADVHVATDICRYIMFRVMDGIFGERKYPFKALVACVPDEEDVLGSEVFANFLEIKGWSVSYIGHGFSAEDILHAIDTGKPQAVVLSAASISWLPSTRKLIGQIRASAPEVKLFLEGRAVQLSRSAFEPLVEGIVSGFDAGHAALLEAVVPHA